MRVSLLTPLFAVGKVLWGDPLPLFGVFVDVEPPKDALLYKVAERGIGPEYGRRLLSPFPNA